MLDSHLSTKFGINLLDSDQENVFYGWTMMDPCAMTLALLTQSSNAKNCNYP